MHICIYIYIYIYILYYILHIYDPTQRPCSTFRATTQSLSETSIAQ